MSERADAYLRQARRRTRRATTHTAADEGQPPKSDKGLVTQGPRSGEADYEGLIAA